MKYASVCSGIEAPSVAWGPLGWEPAFFSEIAAFPSAVLQYHYPTVPNLGDMTTLLKDERSRKSTIDVLIGGTPCQSFSVAGLRKGLDDPRGNLALVFLGIVDRLRPKWVVWENVPGVLSSNKGRDFGSFVGALGQLGYGWAYRILDAQYFGVPQRRRRVFVVGHLGSWTRAAAVLFERESLSGNSPPRRKAGPGIAANVAPSLTRDGQRAVNQQDAQNGGLIAFTQNSRDEVRYIDGDGGIVGALAAETGSKQQNYLLDTDLAHTLRAEHDASEDGSGRGTPIIPVSNALHGNKSPGYNTEHDTLIFEPRIARNGRGQPSEVCPTLNGASSGETSDSRPVVFQSKASATNSMNPGEVSPTMDRSKSEGLSVFSGAGVRRLTPIECERLQGFPDNYTRIPWRLAKHCAKKGLDFEAEIQKRGLREQDPSTFDCADGPRYRAIGNSMARPVIEWLGRRIELIESIIEGQ